MAEHEQAAKNGEGAAVSPPSPVATLSGMLKPPGGDETAVVLADPEVRLRLVSKRLAELDTAISGERAAARKLARPWWLSWNLAAVTGLLAAITPVTVGVQGCIEKGRQTALEDIKLRHELAMADRKQTEDIRAAYLDRLKDPHDRKRVLRFLAVTSSDRSIADWAGKELPIVAGEADEQKREYDGLRKAADVAWDQAVAAAKDPTAHAELKKERARALQTAVDASPAKQWGAAGGDHARAESLSRVLATERAAFQSCWSGSNTLSCNERSRLAKVPEDADLDKIRQLEARAFDPTAHDELMRERAIFLKADR